MIYKCVIIWFLLLLAIEGQAQDEWDLFLQAGVDDAGLMIQNYFKPVFEGVGYGFTNGWYNTAKPHETLGFDISLSGNIAFVPQSRLTYTFNNSDFTNIQLSSGGSTDVSTVLGPFQKGERPELTFYNNGDEVIRATSPPGAIDLKEEIGFNAIPVPMVQAGIGIIKETDIIVRFIPPLSFGDDFAKIGMIGFGVKHNLGQWITMLDYSGIDVSFLAGYSNLKIRTDLSKDSDPATQQNEGIFNINGLVLQGIVSKEYVNIFTIYGALGFSRAGSRTQILGFYPINDPDFEPLPEDPIDLKYGNGSMNLTAGLRIRLVAITINTAYTFQEYPVLSLGLGVSVR
ncbi:MAG: DUF6588 family protein [Bacteroidota bacterium]